VSSAPVLRNLFDGNQFGSASGSRSRTDALCPELPKNVSRKAAIVSVSPPSRSPTGSRCMRPASTHSSEVTGDVRMGTIPSIRSSRPRPPGRSQTESRTRLTQTIVLDETVRRQSLPLAKLDVDPGIRDGQPPLTLKGRCVRQRLPKLLGMVVPESATQNTVI
jgi:hypothetical protein